MKISIPSNWFSSKRKKMEKKKRKKNDRNTTLLQQVYNSPLTWGGPHTLWDPPHMRGLLYTCCKSVVRESVLKKN
jgi:hypothetical protein